MKFTVSKQDFFQVLQKVSNVTPLRSTLPILSCILFTVKDNILKMRSTDLEITMSASCPVDMERDGAIAIPSKIIKEITAELPDTNLHFTIEDEQIIITTDAGGEYRIMGYPAMEFPTEPIVDNSKMATLQAEKFRRIVDKTGFAVSRDEMKVALNGVLLQFRENELRAVSTDGHRLVRYRLKEYQGAGNIKDIIVPPKFLNLCVASIRNVEFITLRIGNNHIMLELDDTTVYSRIIEERFPDYESVIPADNDKKILVNIDELLSVVKRVGIFASRNTRQISLSFSTNKAVVKAEDIETSSTAKEHLSLSYNGEEFTIGYNSDYLREMIRHIDGESVEIHLKNAIMAGLFFPTEQLPDEEILFLLMPIRLI
ncbi:MAG: DNA polymerase III subunit beta [Candidatus Neomarinimicrobiota bacterium]|jgi:DNA polymerase-3 subunit beta|nr:DNA polymerase III subunit beta [Candidatus Neomarinimicrobiota bacterium]MDD3966417.1 DNA polymerase III subunit beta [Candidatus Neomarinimicrobiota bacterium]MDX9780030.1 DNA polymerase III subunit beta [bacterium]